MILKKKQKNLRGKGPPDPLVISLQRLTVVPPPQLVSLKTKKKVFQYRFQKGRIDVPIGGLLVVHICMYPLGRIQDFGQGGGPAEF